MMTVIWDIHAVILVDMMPKADTINPEAYNKILKTLKKCFHKVQPHKIHMHTLLKFENPGGYHQIALDYASSSIYSPDLAPKSS